MKKKPPKSAADVANVRREASGPMWKNRIVGYGEEAPDQLLANPMNWRGHPIEQQNVVEQLLETVGWVNRIIVNKRTGHVVDGHLRIDLAMRREEETVPVAYIDVSEDEERLILASLDPSAAMAFTDHEKLEELVDLLPDDLQALMAVLHLEKEASTHPVEFTAVDENIETEHACPKYGYSWSGKG